MATRIYPSTGSAAISPTVDGSWEFSDPSFSRWPAAASTATYPTAGNSSTALGSGVANDDTCVFQLVFGPIAAQTITGTVKGQFGCREANAASDADGQVVIRVIAPNGSTVRGTLLASDTSALASEFAVSTGAQTNNKFPKSGAATLSSVTAQDGDYIVVEVGFRNHGTNTGACRVGIPGGDQSNGDLPEDTTTTPVSNYRAWVEFSQTITLSNPQITTTDTLTASDTFSGGNQLATVTDTLTVTDAFSFSATADLGHGTLWIGRFTDEDPAYTIGNEVLEHAYVNEGRLRPNVVVVDGDLDSWTEYDQGDLVAREAVVTSYLDLPEIASPGDVRQRAVEEINEGARANSPGGDAVWYPHFTRMDRIYWIAEDGSKYETRIEGLKVDFDQSTQPFQRATIDTGLMVLCPPDEAITYVARDLFDRNTAPGIGVADIGGTWTTY